jgi:hypothetical protein
LGGALLTAATATILLLACDLDLKPFVDSPDVVFASQNRDATVGDGGSDLLDGGGGGDAQLPEVDAAGLKRVFVTSTTVPGAFLDRGGGQGAGVDGGDTICNALAAQAQLNGRFIAWISIAGTPALGRLTGNGPWYLVDRKTRVFANKAALTAAPHAENEIDRDEKGTRIEGNRRTWTGTLSTGAAAGTAQNCTNFTQPIGNGMSGEANEKDARWTQSGVQECTQSLRLYCFEQ